jgi:hypothetical protein
MTISLDDITLYIKIRIYRERLDAQPLPPQAEIGGRVPLIESPEREPLETQKSACIRLPYPIWIANDETAVPLPTLFSLTL